MVRTPSYGYFAGGLFSSKDLCGNALLANQIFKQSKETLIPVLPQNLEQREHTGASIRSTDLLALARSDWAIFQFDGTELDSGTVVEHELAKFLDIPYVLLRTDFRSGGDASDLPWNLMNRPGPRGEAIVVDAMGEYRRALCDAQQEFLLEGDSCAALLRYGEIALERMHAAIAGVVIDTLTQVRSRHPILSAQELTVALEICAKTTGENFEEWLTPQEISAIVSRRPG